MMRKLFTVAAVICLVIVGYTYLNPQQSNFKKSNNNNVNAPKVGATNKSNKPLESVTISANYATLYSDINELAQSADVIVEGQVIEVSYFDFNTATQTKFRIKVSNSFNSNAKEGDILTFVEPGGITTKEALMNSNENKFNEPIEENEKNTKVQVLLEGAPLTKLNDKILLFGQLGTLKMLPEKYYGPIGAFQGKFHVNDDIIERFVPQSLQKTRYSSLKMSKSEFNLKIKKN